MRRGGVNEAEREDRIRAYRDSDYVAYRGVHALQVSTPVLADGRRMVRLRDVATVHDTHEQASSHYRIDGRPAVSFEVFRASGSNAVRVADAVRAAVDALDPAPPAGVRLILDDDQSEAIRAQLSDLQFRALIAAGVIFLVLLLFLKSVRSAAIVFTTIAFSVMITLNLVYFGGLSLNMLTLMGLALGFGLVVDNAIVVLESVHERWRRGALPAAAAEQGALAARVDTALPYALATQSLVLSPGEHLLATEGSASGGARLTWHVLCSTERPLAQLAVPEGDRPQEVPARGQGRHACASHRRSPPGTASSRRLQASGLFRSAHSRRSRPKPLAAWHRRSTSRG